MTIPDFLPTLTEVFPLSEVRKLEIIQIGNLDQKLSIPQEELSKEIWPLVENQLNNRFANSKSKSSTIDIENIDSFKTALTAELKEFVINTVNDKLRIIENNKKLL